jgi:hypothetical protein
MLLKQWYERDDIFVAMTGRMNFFFFQASKRSCTHVTIETAVLGDFRGFRGFNPVGCVRQLII